MTAKAESAAKKQQSSRRATASVRPIGLTRCARAPCARVDYVCETPCARANPVRASKRDDMRRAQMWSRRAIPWLLLPLVAGCAGAPRDASLPIRDPNEHVNRQVMAANQELLRPISEAVKAVVPGPVHDRLHDLNSNLKEPRIFVNNVLQWRFQAAAHTATRFVLNSTFGMGGLLDVAGREGIAQESGDFGQTLFVWGVSEGPYTVRPYLGPSTLRDAVGSTVDMIANPVGWLIGTQVALATTQVAVTVGTTSLDAVDRLGQLKQAEDASIDFY